MPKYISCLFLSSSLFLFPLSASHAAGFYIQEQSVSGLGNAFSGSTTNIRDASTIYFNPAGMTRVEGTNINVGVHALLPRGEIENDGSTIDFGGGPVALTGDGGDPYELTLIPNLFTSHQVNNDTWIGFGVTAPWGIGNDYSDNWFARSDSIESSLQTLNFTLAFGHQLNDWMAIGAGFDAQYARAMLESITIGGPGVEGVSTLEGESWTFGANAGLLLTPFGEQTRFGLHYRSEMKHDINGSLSLDGLGVSDFYTDGFAELDLPDIATAGIAHDLNDQWTVMGQVTWFGWENFDNIRAFSDAGPQVQFVEQNYNNTIALSAGVEYHWSDDLTLRAGYQFDETPSVDDARTTRTPDGDRHWIAGGMTYAIDDKWSLDLSGAYIAIRDESINVTRAAPTSTATIRGNVDGADVFIGALGVNYKF